MSREIHKVSLLVLNQDATSFLTCQKRKGAASQLIMPGGKIEAGETDEECVHREINEELGCGIVAGSLKYVAGYEAPAAGETDTTLYTKLYIGELDAEPVAQQEIAKLVWLSAAEADDPIVSFNISQRIIPDILRRGLLHSAP